MIVLKRQRQHAERFAESPVITTAGSINHNQTHSTMSHSIGNETTVDRSDVNNDACADNLLLAEQMQALERLKEARSGYDRGTTHFERAKKIVDQDAIFKLIDFDAIKRFMAATPFVGSASPLTFDPTDEKSENGSRSSSTSRSRSLSRSRSRDSITPSSSTTSRASRSSAGRGRSRTRKKLFFPEDLLRTNSPRRRDQIALPQHASAKTATYTRSTTS